METDTTSALMALSKAFLDDSGPRLSIHELADGIVRLVGAPDEAERLPRVFAVLDAAARAYLSGEDTGRTRRLITPLIRAAERTAVDLVLEEALRNGFEYPRELLQVHLLGLNLVPWHFLHSGRMAFWHDYVRAEAPELTVVPIAGRQDMDELACLDTSTAAVIHIDTEARGAEVVGTAVPTIREWMHRALDDSLEFY